jgi:hypothetical protein
VTARIVGHGFAGVFTIAVSRGAAGAGFGVVKTRSLVRGAPESPQTSVARSR